MYVWGLAVMVTVAGVTFTNESKYEDLVILKHFGPDHNIIEGDPKQRRLVL